MHDLETILTALHDSEINVEISSFPDRAWTVKLGDRLNGFAAAKVVANIDEAAEWLRVIAIKLYPESDFARRYGGRSV